MPHYADTSAYTAEEQELWALLLRHADRTYRTAKGLEFTYTIKGNELFISRKEKSITRATVNQAYRRAMEVMRNDGCVSGPKKLGTFGASYLFPVFLELGFIRK